MFVHLPVTGIVYSWLFFLFAPKSNNVKIYAVVLHVLGAFESDSNTINCKL